MFECSLILQEHINVTIHSSSSDSSESLHSLGQSPSEMYPKAQCQVPSFDFVMQHFLNEYNRVMSEGKDTHFTLLYQESTVQKVLRYTKRRGCRNESGPIRLSHRGLVKITIVVISALKNPQFALNIAKRNDILSCGNTTICF